MRFFHSWARVCLFVFALPLACAALPPSFITAPPSTAITVAEHDNLHIDAGQLQGTQPFTYSWNQDGTILPDAIWPTLDKEARTTSAGKYTLTVSNAEGSVTSPVISVTVVDPIKIILPYTVEADPGTNVTFTPTVTGPGPLTYSWENPRDFNNVMSSDPTLTLKSVSVSDTGNYDLYVSNNYQTVHWSVTLSVTVAPSLTSQPTDKTYMEGDYGSLDAQTYLVAPGIYTYTWTKDGRPLFVTSSGTYVSSYVGFNRVSADDAGTYTFTVSNSKGTVTSNPFKVIVQPNPQFPKIITQPASTTVTPGSPVTFSAVISGTGPFIYEWTKDGYTVPGANSPSYTIASAALSDAGTYTLVIFSNSGFVQSAPAVLSVGDVPLTRVTNLSTRANVGTGANVLIAGFIINGSTPKRILIRALGPTLTNYSVSNPLADPTLKIVESGGNTLISNDDWQVTSQLDDLNAATAQVGAVPLPAGSRDAAILTMLPPGGYTALVSGKSGATGVALVELYEVDTNTVNQLVNISSRANVGTGQSVTIAGVIVSGSASKKFLIRAIGPGLLARGVQGFLPDPQFQVVDSSNHVLASNDNWETSDTLADIKSVTSQVNAVPLEPGSKDAALTMTLAPGGYTVVVRGAGTSSGVALVEAYQVP